MPYTTIIEQRDRALVAFTLMTGCRDGATVSLKLQHIDLCKGCVALDAREVDTKNSKSFTTFFMPVGEDIRAMFEAWVALLTDGQKWGPSDPLFPAPLMGHDPLNGFCVVGIKREHWTTTNAVRRIFQDAFKRANLPPFHPHSFRHTLAQLGEQICQTPEEFKAWSQNLGHEHVMTTFNSYGNVAADRQAAIIQGLGNPAQREADDLLRGLTDLLKGKAKA
jgi:integrase